MTITRSRKRWLRRSATALAVGATLAASLAACSSGSDTSGSTQSGDAKSIAHALQKKTTITVWTWGPPVKKVAEAFEKKYPKITVKVVNAGTGTDEYTKLQNAIKAGSGAPDIAQIEYYALPQFALSGALANLKSFGFDDLKSKFTESTWDTVNINKELVALPQDSGPMALFYNKSVFDKYGLTVPSTWAEYVADAKKLHAANPDAYITNDAGDPGFVTSMIWSAGGKPYKVTGTKNVTINLQDAGAKKFTSTWDGLVQGDLLSTIPSWSDQWYQALSNGSIATLVTGAWMPADLESGVASGSGKWRVAPMPTWEANGAPATAANGGSSDAVLTQSKHQLVAAAFLKYMNADDDGAQIQIDAGSFPSTTHALSSTSWQNEKSAYFGGQQINKVLSQAADTTIPGWSYLPFQVYANSIFSDTVGQAYKNKTGLDAGLKKWQKLSASYGKQEGFTVTSK